MVSFGNVKWLALHVVRHLVFHLFIRINANELGEHGLEVSFGHAGEADEVTAGKDEDTLISEKSFKRFEPGIVETMAWYGQPDEVVGTIVVDMAVEMMALLTLLWRAMKGSADNSAD